MWRQVCTICLCWLVFAVVGMQVFEPDGFVEALLTELAAEKTDLVQTVREKYTQDPNNVNYNNLMGTIEYYKKDWQEALRYFERACKFNNYADIGYMNNFASVHRLVYPDRSVETLLVATTTYPDNIVILRELLEAYRSAGRWRVAEEALQTSLLQRPEAYDKWILLADSIAQRLTNVPEIHNVSLSGSEIDTVTEELAREADLVVYGLSMFPRSPQLLLLRAYHYLYLHKSTLITYSLHAQNLHTHGIMCATHFLRNARRVWMSTSHSQPLSDHYLALAGRIATHTGTATAHVEPGSPLLEDDDVEMNDCVPALYRHDASSYGPVFHMINRVTGDTPWHAMSTARFPGAGGGRGSDVRNEGNTYNSLVPSGITKLLGPEGSAPLYLPSLQIGCSNTYKCAQAGWLVADALATTTTHFVTQAYDLHALGTASVGLVYSSHTLEHLSHNNPPTACPSFPVSTPFVRGESSGHDIGSMENSERAVSCWSELDSALAEWRRVLVVGGKLLVSVPDVQVIFKLFIEPNVRDSLLRKEILRNILYGGQKDQFDFHKNGFYYEYLEDLLLRHGFCNVTRVDYFNVFLDTSMGMFNEGQSFSINVHAISC